MRQREYNNKIKYYEAEKDSFVEEQIQQTENKELFDKIEEWAKTDTIHKLKIIEYCITKLYRHRENNTETEELSMNDIVGVKKSQQLKEIFQPIQEYIKNTRVDVFGDMESFFYYIYIEEDITIQIHCYMNNAYIDLYFR